MLVLCAKGGSYASDCGSKVPEFESSVSFFFPIEVGVARRQKIRLLGTTPKDDCRLMVVDSSSKSVICLGIFVTLPVKIR